tara:strand:+ start:4786 stop:8139 length:3354 start_codon:yes stop_codon:yes gene_type:complete
MNAQAQSVVRASFQIELNDTYNTVPIGPNTYVTKQTNSKITREYVIKRFMNNFRGERQTQEIVNLGFSYKPAWVVFSVANNSQEEDWILNFGNAFNGRYAQIKELMIHDYTNNQTFIDTTGTAPVPESLTPFLQTASVPVTIPRGKTSIFVVYIQTETPLFRSFSPRLIPKERLVSHIQSVNIYNLLLYLSLFTLAGFFAAIAILKEDYSYSFFSAYFITFMLCFFIIQNSFMSTYGMIGGSIMLLICLAITLGLALTKFFFSIQKDDDPKQFSALLFCGIVLSVLGISNLIPGLNMISHILTLAFIVFSCLLILFNSTIQMQRGKFGSPYFATGWAVLFISLIATGATLYGFIPANAITVNTLWILLLLQAFFFIMASLQKIILMDEQNRQMQVRENRQLYNAERLKQSKKSADQARLLRVIEREREVMAELRERERQRSEEMRIAKETADRANDAKSAFLAVVSHEIRTPMTGIMGMIRLILDTKLSSKQSDYIQAMQKSGDTMMALLNDILDFEKIETGNMKLEKISFDLLKLINGVVTLMSAYADEKGIYVRADIAKNTPQYVMGDPTRIRQVILNLINNAIKFTENGGVTIRVKSTPLPKDGSKANHHEVYIGIEDTGIGISQEAQDKLFTPFTQAESSTTRQYGGTGLGLAICKNLIENMNSSIQVESEVGEGSTFYFSLMMEEGDRDQIDEDQDADTAGQETDTGPQKILIVEDNQINRRVLFGLMEKFGHKPTAVIDGEEAIAKLSSEHFDLIFTDINLHGMSGVETARTIRSMADIHKARTPIIALTGNTQQKDIQSYYEAGMNGALSKPIDPKKLATTINNAAKNIFDNPLPEQKEWPSEPEEQNAQTRSAPPPPQPEYTEEPYEPMPNSDLAQTEQNAPTANDAPAHSERGPSPIEPESNPETAPTAATQTQSHEPQQNHRDSPSTEAPPLPEPPKAETPKAEAPKQALPDIEIKDNFVPKTEKSALEKFAEEHQNTPDAVVAGVSEDKKLEEEHLNLSMMNELLETLGKEAIASLFNDYYSFADKIIDTLMAEKETKNAEALVDRSHELKGMAANFGFGSISKVAGEIESLSKKGDVDATLPLIDQLPVLNEASQKAAKNWLSRT